MANALELRAGQKLRSAVSDAQLIVVRAPASAVDLRCGGVPVLAEGDEPSGEPADADLGEGPLIGKRYASEAAGIELLCTRGGDGALSIGDEPLEVKGAKPLPSSD